jgi:hypothetical protein
MPLPKPREGETQSKFVSRCVSFVNNSGEASGDQAVAICYTQWRKAKGLKTVREDVQTYLVEYARRKYTGAFRGVISLYNKIRGGGR